MNCSGVWGNNLEGLAGKSRRVSEGGTAIHARRGKAML